MKFKVVKKTQKSLVIQGLRTLSSKKVDNIASHISSSGMLQERHLYYKDTAGKFVELIVDNDKVVGRNYPLNEHIK